MGDRSRGRRGVSGQRSTSAARSAAADSRGASNDSRGNGSAFHTTAVAGNGLRSGSRSATGKFVMNRAPRYDRRTGAVLRAVKDTVEVEELGLAGE